jgi:hypothetical protein
LEHFVLAAQHTDRENPDDKELIVATFLHDSDINWAEQMSPPNLI